MIRTLVASKRIVVAPVRSKLLSLGYSEEVEYDAINIEPVLVYNKLGRTVFLKHKWEMVALVPIQHDVADPTFHVSKAANSSSIEFTDEDGKRWLKFELPSKEEELFLYLTDRNRED